MMIMVDVYNTRKRNIINSRKRIGVTYASVYKQASDMGETINECVGHNGVGKRFNYFPHIPRPGYVKESEWNQAFYNNITLHPSNYAPYGTYKQLLCHCFYGGTCPPPVQFGELCAGPLFSVDSLSPTGCCTYPLPTTVKDLTCILFGTLVDHGITGPETEIDTQPRYTKVACGLYNTLCLTNENRLENICSILELKQMENHW